MKKRFFNMPGGQLKRVRNRFGGHDGEHDRYSALERRRVLARVLDEEFDGCLKQLGNDDGQPVSEPLSTWTLLTPMSGKFQTRIYLIEGDYELALRVYAARNGNRHPEKVSCDCGCGADYFVDTDYGSLRQVTASLRNCRFVKRGGQDVAVEGRCLSKPGRWDYQSLEQFCSRPDVTLIRKEEISQSERQHAIPERTTPSMYSEDAQLLGWLLDAEF